MTIKKEYRKQYYEQNKDKLKERAKIWSLINKDEIKIKQREYYLANREKILARQKEYVKNNKEKIYLKRKEYLTKNPQILKKSQDKWLENNPEYDIYHNAKRRAKDKNIDFDIHWSELKIPEYCPVLGIPIIKGIKNSSENSPSIDRIIPEKGYVKGNVAIISSKANRLKQNATLEELKAIIRYIEDNMNQSMLL